MIISLTVLNVVQSDKLVPSTGHDDGPEEADKIRQVGTDRQMNTDIAICTSIRHVLTHENLNSHSAYRKTSFFVHPQTQWHLKSDQKCCCSVQAA